MEHNQGVTASPPGHSPSGLSPVARSQAKPSVPNAVKLVAWMPKKGLQGWTVFLTKRRSIKVALGRTKHVKRMWSVRFRRNGKERNLAIPDDTMKVLIEAVKRIQEEERRQALGWEARENLVVRTMCKVVSAAVTNEYPADAQPYSGE